MSDQATSLPIRSEADGADERVHIKFVDFADPAGTDKQAEVSEKLVHVRAFGQDPADTKVQLRLSETGRVNPDGKYDSGDNTLPASVGVVAATRDAAPGVTKQTVQITSIQDGGGTVRALDVALHDEAGEPFGSDNPLPVFMVENEGGVDVQAHAVGSAIAKDATSVQSYAPASGKTLLLQKIAASASGKMKVQIAWGPTGSETNKVVLFNSTANPNVEYEFAAPTKLDDTMTLKVTKTNLDNTAQDLYSTIEGVLLG